MARAKPCFTAPCCKDWSANYITCLLPVYITRYELGSSPTLSFHAAFRTVLPGSTFILSALLIPVADMISAWLVPRTNNRMTTPPSAYPLPSVVPTQVQSLPSPAP